MDGLFILIVAAVVIAVLGLVVSMVLPRWQERQERKKWAAGGTPDNINWTLLLSPGMQTLLADSKQDAIVSYWKQSKLDLKTAQNAIEFASLYPDRVAAHQDRFIIIEPSQVKKMINWDILYSPELQVLLPSHKDEAINLYQQRSKAPLSQARAAVEHYIATQNREQKGS